MAPRELRVRLLYATTTGTAARLADALRKRAFALRAGGWHVALDALDLAADPGAWEEGLEAAAAAGDALVILLPTWTGGAPPPGAAPLCARAAELASDFRVSKDALKGLHYALFGLGCADYRGLWCAAALALGADLDRLGATPLAPTGRGDDGGDIDAQCAAWAEALWPALRSSLLAAWRRRRSGRGRSWEGGGTVSGNRG